MTTSSRPSTPTMFLIAASAEACEVTSSSMERRSTLFSLANFAAASTCEAFFPAVSRMLAYTTCPAFARALAVRAPKPLDAPVMRMILRIHTPLVRHVRFVFVHLNLCKASVCTEYLCVDPSSVRSNEEGNGGGDVFWCSEPLQRS